MFGSKMCIGEKNVQPGWDSNTGSLPNRADAYSVTYIFSACPKCVLVRKKCSKAGT
jgi:hypothetical protein